MNLPMVAAKTSVASRGTRSGASHSRRGAQNRLCALLFAILLIPCQGAAAAPDSDPLEPLNRGVFAFNEVADRWVLRPVAKTYSFILPSVVRRGVANALRNLRDVNYAVNAALQGRFRDAGTNGARFAINTTIGLVGVFDVATHRGFVSSPADFGETLATAGLPAGPFIVLPVIGPSTMRDGAGFAVDAAVLSVPSHIDSSDVRAAIWGTGIVQARSGFLDMDDLPTGDSYIFAREAYLQRRAARLGEATFTTPGSFWEFEEEF
ncbi:MlaA family lipoprotein [Congregibacter litoralis]|uniref:Surface lipoprotein n=1 Tax=Congregibacter litoralis KT71 TaxID=314285 RepID=A4AAE8_9GAMM|nr:VacJ family lipoprotein [Congregibacter litoralis]EAQ97025.2 Surface lipoprotein [Congregibacter litoralis KT71]